MTIRERAEQIYAGVGNRERDMEKEDVAWIEEQIVEAIQQYLVGTEDLSLARAQAFARRWYQVLNKARSEGLK